MTDTSWMEATSKLTNKLKLCAEFKMDCAFNPSGAEALRDLIIEMARRLDFAVEIVGRPYDKNDTRPYNGKQGNAPDQNN